MDGQRPANKAIDNDRFDVRFKTSRISVHKISFHTTIFNIIYFFTHIDLFQTYITSCARTAQEEQPWWAVELSSVFPVKTVVVTSQALPHDLENIEPIHIRNGNNKQGQNKRKLLFYVYY